MRHLPVLCLTAFALSAPAFAQDANVAASADKKLPDPNKKMCRTIESTGSAFAGHECHTRAEWHAIDAANSGNQSGAATSRALQGQHGMQVPRR